MSAGAGGAWTLYSRDGSGAFAVEAALALAGATFQRIDVPSRPGTPLPEDFRAVNPWRQVPVLVLPDGDVLTETAACLVHIAACHPQGRLAPPPGTPGHAHFLRWVVFASVNAYEAVLRVTYPARYTSDAGCADAVREAAIARNREALSVLEDAIDPGPFLLGDAMGAADPYLAMLRVWFRGEIDAPRLGALAERVRSHPVVGPIWRRHYGER